jgi:hypothetical protein
MNKLFIIGNGFDLAHGLKTSYSDFILWYFKQAIRDYKSNKSYSDKIINSITRLPEDELKHLSQIIELTERNKNFILLTSPFGVELINAINKQGWVDIELLYYSIIKSIINTSSYNIQTKIQLIKQINDALFFLKIKLIEYIQTLPTIFPSNNSIEMHIKSELNKSRIDNENNKKSISLKKRDTENKILFVNFNYTPTLEIYLTQELVYYQLYIDNLHIHGSIKENANSVIFGYGDEMDADYKNIENYNENEFLKNMKSFGYFHSNNYKKLIDFINDNEFEVHLMGHSCGLSDRVLLNTIFEHDQCYKIRIYYHEKSEKENNFTDLTMNISRHFNDKAKMRQRVEPITSCVPLS